MHKQTALMLSFILWLLNALVAAINRNAEMMVISLVVMVCVYGVANE